MHYVLTVVGQAEVREGVGLVHEVIMSIFQIVVRFILIFLAFQIVVRVVFSFRFFSLLSSSYVIISGKKGLSELVQAAV